MAKRARTIPKEHIKAIEAGWRLLQTHPLFGRLTGLATLSWSLDGPDFAKDGYARLVVSKVVRWHGYGTQASAFDYAYRLAANPLRRAEPAEWANVLGQALLHIVLNHTDPCHQGVAWRTAADLEAVDLLRNVGIGVRPPDFSYPDLEQPGRTIEAMAAFIERGGLEALTTWGGHGIAGKGQASWIYLEKLPEFDARTRRQNTTHLANAFRASVLAAVEAAGTAARGPGNVRRNPNSMAERARAWFIASYPLLAALAAAFEIVEDAELCERLDIRIAAVDAEARHVYVNPKFAWTPEGMRFVIAHELMHVGLAHFARRQGRDPYLWNVACDYVINGWLIEMGVGLPPTDDLLLDPELGFERESAEAIYDRIVRDLRLMRRLGKVMTPRGRGKCDMLGDRPPGWWRGPGADLDAFYRRALAEGLDLHVRQETRGLLPGNFIEEIRALQQPPIPWDVKLGHWLDAFFPPIERRRSFARASRRQSSTPDIPRAVYVAPPELVASRTFGVVVDTSGSMSRQLLARAFGAIASYAMSREVPLVRIVQCDAGVNDMGFVEAERLFERIEVKGRGGTVLRPAIDRLERADDFPVDAPILIITDGQCDVLQPRREHAFLMPEGARLPFRTGAHIFHFEPVEE